MVRSIRERPRSFMGHQHATSRGVIPRLWLPARPVNSVSRVVFETSSWALLRSAVPFAREGTLSFPPHLNIFLPSTGPLIFHIVSHFFAIYVQQVRPARSFHLLIIDGFTRGAHPQTDCKLLSFAKIFIGRMRDVKRSHTSRCSANFATTRSLRCRGRRCCLKQIGPVCLKDEPNSSFCITGGRKERNKFIPLKHNCNSLCHFTSWKSVRVIIRAELNCCRCSFRAARIQVINGKSRALFIAKGYLEKGQKAANWNKK